MAKKIYRTVIQYEILSEEPYNGENLQEIAFETFEGSWSGNLGSTPVLNEELSGSEAIKAIENQGSDPEFFGIELPNVQCTNCYWEGTKEELGTTTDLSDENIGDEIGYGVCCPKCRNEDIQDL